LDLQFCDALVNYDLPWNPMVVEQRIGRIDRFGQKSQIVNIYNVIVKKSIQEEIFKRLLMRIDIFRGCIGDLEAILDKETEQGNTLQERIVKLEKELYCTVLSEEERVQKIENISKAILFEKQNLEDINKGLTDTLTNDSYFRNEIENIQTNYRYITEHELYNYLLSAINNCLTECSLKNIREGIYKFNLPLSNKTYLINFLNRYLPVVEGSETEYLFRRFINSIRGLSEFELTFNQDVAYNNQDIIFANAYHPLIIAAKEYFKQHFKESNSAFQFGIRKERFSDIQQIKNGDYFLAVYLVYLTKTLFGKEQNNEILTPIVFDIQSNSIVDDKAISDRFLGESQLFATVNQIPCRPQKEMIDEVRIEMAEKINSIYNSYIEDQEMRMETNKAMQIQQTEEFYNNRIKILEQTISDMENRVENTIYDEERAGLQRVLPAQRGQLRILIAEKEEAIQKISNSNIQSKEPKLLSLSQIKIY